MSSSLRQGLNPRQTETVEKLLAAAEEELRAVGVEGLTVRTVAARAGVSAATAYTYLASKNHLFAELFLRHLQSDLPAPPAGRDPVRRVQAVTRHLATSLAASPALAAGVTMALLGTDPDVARLRLRIGAEYLNWFAVALGETPDPAVLETLSMAFSGALLQAGMGLMTYTEMGERLDVVVATILRGNT